VSSIGGVSSLAAEESRAAAALGRVEIIVGQPPHIPGASSDQITAWQGQVQDAEDAARREAEAVSQQARLLGFFA